MKFNKIFSTLFAGSLLFGAAACTDEVKYDETKPETTNQVYLSNTDSNVIDLGLDQQSFNITVYRVKTEGEVTVDIASSAKNPDGSSSGIFTIPGAVTFLDGESTADIQIGCVFSQLVADADYAINITLEGDELTPYGLSSRDYVVHYAPWSEWELYSETEPGVLTLNAAFSGDEEGPVYYRKSLINSNNEQYRFLKRYSNVEFDYILSVDKSKNVGTADAPVYPISMQPYDSKYLNTNYNENMWFTDIYTYLVQVIGRTPEDALAIMESKDYGESTFDASKGLFNIFVVPYISQGNFTPAYEYIQLPGFADYSVQLSTNGHFVAEDGTEYQVVAAYKSDDLKSFGYKMVSGALDEAGIEEVAQEIVDDAEGELVYETMSNLTFALGENGQYTIVAVGYDEKGVRQSVDYLTFTYSSVKVDEDAGWTSLGFCEYTDGFFAGMYGMSPYTWDVEIQQNDENPSYYRLVNPYTNGGWPANADGSATTAPGNYYMYIDASNAQCVLIEASNIGITADQDGNISLCNAAWFYYAGGNAIDDIIGAGYGDTMEDGVMVFEPKNLRFNWAAEPEKWYSFKLDENSVPTIVDMSTISAASSPRQAQAKATVKAASKAGAERLPVYRNAKVSSKKIRDYKMSQGFTAR